jgi:HlyD family secretion protein
MDLKKVFKKTESAFFDKEQGPVQLIALHSWLIVFSCAFGLLVLLLWSLFGTVYTRVYGDGILIPGSSNIYPVAPKYSGIVKEILVARGELVQAGAVVAKLDTTYIDKKIINQKRYIAQLEAEQEEIFKRVGSQKKALDVYHQELVKALMQKKEFGHEYREYLSKFLSGVKGMREKGYVSLPKFEQYKDQYYDTVNTILQTMMSLAKSRFSLEQQQYSMFEKVTNIRLNLIQRYNELSVLEEQREETRHIRAETSGRVISIMGTIGKYIAKGSPLVNLVPKSEEETVFVLFEPLEGKRIREGMEAYAAPTYIDKYRYGSILGKVKEINMYPANQSAVLSVILEQSWLKQLGFNGNAMLMAKVQLDHDKMTYSGFKWTSSEGPPHHITPGSFLRVMVNVKEQAPITLVIPLLRRWLGVEA